MDELKKKEYNLVDSVCVCGLWYQIVLMACSNHGRVCGVWPMVINYDNTCQHKSNTCQ